jgi:hypothetical protein
VSGNPQRTVPSDVRAAAAFYLGLGYLPVPVPRAGRHKAPVLDGWPDLRPTPEDLDRLFPPGQRLNLGLLTGAPSGGLIDIDLDVAEALAVGPQLLPTTGWISGRKGKPRSHWWYVVGDPHDKAQDPYRDLDGTMLVEVHSTRWQVVAPPSVHESGEAVLWHAFTQPAPVDLAALLTAVRSVAAVTLLARHWPGQGARQDSFLALGGGLLRAGWAKGRVERFIEALAVATQDDEARKRVQTVAQTARKLEQGGKTTGWPRLEALLGPAGKGVLQRIRQWLGFTLTGTTATGATPAARGVRVLEPYQPFPVEALPDPLREYVRQGAVALGCDPAYLALPVLAVAAGLIGYTRVLRLKRTWRESTVLWSLIVGESGTLKSPAYRLATDYLFPLQRRLHRQYQEDYARFLQDKEAYQEAKRRAKEEGTNPGDPPEEPVERIVFSTDATIEALAEIIEDNPRGLLVTCDELTAWFSMFARYHTGKQGCSDLPRWLSMHSAGGFSYHRKTGDRRRIVVPHAAVSVTGGIQPGVLARALTPEFLDAGLAARLLMAMPPKRPKRWTEAEIDPEVEQAYQGTLDKLLLLDFDTGQGERRSTCCASPRRPSPPG